jgi:hypothetical protein
MNSKTKTVGIAAGVVSFLGLIIGASSWSSANDAELVAKLNQTGRLEMENPNAAIGITGADVDSAEIFDTLIGSSLAPNIGCAARIRRNNTDLVYKNPSDFIVCNQLKPALKLTTAQINAQATGSGGVQR